MILHLLRKDCRVLFRSPRTVVSLLFLALLLVVIATFAIRSPAFGQQELVFLLPGVYWMAFFFLSALALNLLFAPEQENLALSGLLLAGARSEEVFLSKALLGTFFLFFLQVVVFLLLIVLFGFFIDPPAFLQILGLSFLVSLGFSALGTLLSSISASLRARDLILPILLFPLCLPLLLAAVSASKSVLLGVGLLQLGFPFVLVIVFDLLALALGLLLFEILLLG